MKRIGTWARAYIGLLGIGLLIFVHECGHFIMAKLFKLSIPTFSIGFPPILASFNVWETQFQLGLLPLGGYVAINPDDMALLPYYAQMIILLAGISCNIIFAWITFFILFYFNFLQTTEQASDPQKEPMLAPIRAATKQTISIIALMVRTLLSYFTTQQRPALAGPVSIITIGSQSLKHQWRNFFIFLAFMSLNLAVFNLIPFPFLDGGQVVRYTIQALYGHPLSNQWLSLINYISMLLFLLLLIYITFKDIMRIKSRKQEIES